MKTIGILIVAIFVVAVAAVLAGPSLVDWNAYRGEIARALGDATGRAVTIGGDLDLALLPSPHLSARDFRMANVAGAVEPDMLRVSELRLRLAVAPLLRGDFTFTSVTLIEPTIALERTAQGLASWDFAAPREVGRDITGDREAPPRQQGVQISVQHVVIADGTLSWSTAGRAPERLQDLDAEIVANGTARSYRIKGTGRYREISIALDGSLGPVGTDAPVPVAATLRLPDDVAILNAALQVDIPTSEASGTVRLTTADAARMVGAIDRAAAESVPAQSLAIESPVHVARGTVSFPDVTLRLGETTGHGKTTLQLDETPSLDVELTVPALDLDALLAATGDKGAAAPTAGAPPAETRRAALPAGVTVKADFSAGTVRLRGGLIRDARLSATLDKGVLSLTSASARLPGATDVSLSGRSVSAEHGIGFTGDLAAAADNLRAALVWAGVDERTVPADRLRGFSYTSRVEVVPDAVHLTDITARLDATRMTGGITVARRARPSFGLRLSLDQLNLDDYLPPPAEKGGRGSPGGGGKQGGDAVFDRFDANFDISAAQLSWHGETARDFRLAGNILKGNATLESATAADLAGAAVKVAGRITGLSATPDADLDFALDGRDPERFARLIGLADGGAARRFGRFQLDAHVSGTVQRAAVRGTLAALGGGVSASGDIVDVFRNPAYDLAITLDKPDGRRLLALVAPEQRWGDIGPVSGRFGLSGSTREVAVRDLDISVGGMPVTGKLDADLAGARPRIAASLVGGHLSLDRFLSEAAGGGEGAQPFATRGSARWSRERLDLSSMRKTDLDLSLKLASLQRRDIRIDGADLHAGLAGGKLTLDRFTGMAFGGRIDLSGSVDATGAAPRIEAKAVGTDLEARTAFGAVGFDRLQGPVSVQTVLRTAGESEFALVSALSGEASVAGSVTARLTKEERTKAGVAGLVGSLLGRKVKEAGFASDALVALLQSFADAPSRLSGDIAIDQGRARTENLTLDGRGARAVTAGVADLANWTLDSRTTLRREVDAGGDPYMVVTLKGPLDDPDIGTSGTWLRGPAPAPTAPVEIQPAPAAPEAPALQPEQPAPEQPEKVDPKKLFLELLRKGLEK